MQYCSLEQLPNCSNPIPLSDLTIKVMLGEYNYKENNKKRPVERFYATNIFLHPQFKNVFQLRKSGFLDSEPQNDIAILKLDREVSNDTLI